MSAQRRLALILCFVILTGLLNAGSGTVTSRARAIRFDGIDIVSIKKYHLERINRDRKAFNLPPVEYDRLASEVADAHCRDMLEHDYFSHWSRDGSKPYMRYSQAGGNDAIVENLSRLWDASLVPSNQQINEILDRFQDRIMAERPPFDGHRKNVLDPDHTHVGIGLAIGLEHVYLAQEFINRHVQIENLPRRANFSDTIIIKGRPLDRQSKIGAISIYYEPLPQPMTIDQLKRTNAYSLPDEEFTLRPRLPTGHYYLDGSKGVITIAPDGSFQAPLVLWRKQPGIYTIVVWLERDDRNFVATNISIRVEN